MDRLQAPSVAGTSDSGKHSSVALRKFSYTLKIARRSFELNVTIDPRTAANLETISSTRKYRGMLLGVAVCLVIFLIWQRCPTAISHAMFWAEDGCVWYPQCYATGWHCLFIDHSAYLQTDSRLVALLSLLVPLALAPKTFALAALLIQGAPAIFLLSPRMALAVPSIMVRAALALLLVAIPGMSEVYVNLTNSQWHLALLAFLILAASAAATWPQRIFDTGVLIVCGLSGPFAPLLVPVALLWWWRDRQTWLLWRLVIMMATAATQLSLVVLHQSTRSVVGGGIGWSLGRLINIVDTNILGVAAFGRQAMIKNDWLVGQGWLSSGRPLPEIIAGGIMIGAALLTVAAALRGRWVLRAFLLFSALEFASSLFDGLSLTQPLWAALEGWIGMRYYFHPIVAWLAVLVTLICDRSLALRTIGTAVMALTVIVAIPADWSLPKHPKTTFRQEAEMFEKAPRGTEMSFRIPPLHSMVLVKH